MKEDTADLTQWRTVAGALRSRFLTGDFVRGVDFIAEISLRAEAAGHHPDIDLRYTHVDITLLTHDCDEVTDKDLALATEITGIATARGIAADPTRFHLVDIALDTPDKDQIAPFWSIALTGSADSADGDDIIDPAGLMPLMWFQHTDALGGRQQSFHLDVQVAADVADDRIAALLEVGGTLVDDSMAPHYTVLADAQGNKVCICSPRPPARMVEMAEGL